MKSEGMSVRKDISEFIRSFAYKPITVPSTPKQQDILSNNVPKKKKKVALTDEERKIMMEERKRKRAAAAREKSKATTLSAEQKRSEAYRRVADDCLWSPPKSSYNLLQETHAFDPWRVMLICMLLNLTTGRQVQGILAKLFTLCPNAETATKVSVEDIEKIIQPLGLQKKRAGMIQRFSCEYLSDNWNYVTQLHGIGKYAADAYAIFCAGKADLVVPHDHKLNQYWMFVRNLKDGNYI